MRNWMLVLCFMFASQHMAAQDFEMIRHQVQMGETIRMISKKYKIEPAEIYRLNKFAYDGINKGMVLQLLVPKKESATSEMIAPDEPEIMASEGELENRSQPEPTVPKAKQSLKNKGQAIAAVPEKTVSPIVVETVLPVDAPVAETPLEEVKHTVAKGETLFGLAKKYNVSATDIKTQNAAVMKKGLQIGQVLTISPNK